MLYPLSGRGTPVGMFLGKMFVWRCFSFMGRIKDPILTDTYHKWNLYLLEQAWFVNRGKDVRVHGTHIVQVR